MRCLLFAVLRTVAIAFDMTGRAQALVAVAALYSIRLVGDGRIADAACKVHAADFVSDAALLRAVAKPARLVPHFAVAADDPVTRLAAAGLAHGRREPFQADGASVHASFDGPSRERRRVAREADVVVVAFDDGVDIATFPAVAVLFLGACLHSI